ncbi:MAG: LemA family protein [Aquificaceae bacterium]
MESLGFWVVVLLILIVLGLILTYNKLVSKRNEIENVLSSLDALLKKRYDLIPNLVATVKEYMEYEKNLLNQLTELRTKALTQSLSLQEKERIDKEISGLLRNITVVAENYPDLKASQNFLQLQQALNEVEEQISAGRRALAAVITDYNTTIQSIPYNFIASIFGFKPVEWYRIGEEERQKPNIKELFKQ